MLESRSGTRPFQLFVVSSSAEFDTSSTTLCRTKKLSSARQLLFAPSELYRQSRQRHVRPTTRVFLRRAFAS